MFRKNHIRNRWKNPPLPLIWGVCVAVLLLVQCSENSTELADEDRRVISALAEAVHVNRDLHNTADSLDLARQALLSKYHLTTADLTRWLESNKDNLKMWQEVEAQIQRGIEDRKKAETPPSSP